MDCTSVLSATYEVRIGDFTYRPSITFPPTRVRQFVESFARQPHTGCWLWVRAKETFTKKYGTTSWKGKSLAAHRLAYMMFVGPIADYIEIHHICINPLCVNPAHLKAKTVLAHRYETAQARHKPFCRNGHAMVGTNVYKYAGREKLRCRACARAWATNYRKVKKLALSATP